MSRVGATVAAVVFTKRQDLAVACSSLGESFPQCVMCSHKFGALCPALCRHTHVALLTSVLAELLREAVVCIAASEWY